jgi:predicted MPP superfamily phosphohydrolase
MKRPKRKLTRRGMLSAIAASVLVPTTVRAERRNHAREYFEITEVEITVPGLDDAHDGLRIAQLSDLHVGDSTPDARIQAAVATVNDEKPDLVMLTGDFVTSSRDPYERVPELLKPLAAHPCYAVLGNHDHWSDAKVVRQGLEDIGVTVLQNRHTVSEINGAPFTVVGIDDSTTRNDDVEQSFKGVGGGSRFVLAHTPTSIDKLPEYEGLFQISGHTHGGQIHLGAFTDKMFAIGRQPYLRGLFHVRGNQLYVNRGLGFGKGSRLPRVNSDPELTFFTLRALG